MQTKHDQVKLAKANVRTLKAQLDSFGNVRTPERNAVFAEYCQAQKVLGQLLMPQ